MMFERLREKLHAKLTEGAFYQVYIHAEAFALGFELPGPLPDTIVQVFKERPPPKPLTATDKFISHISEAPMGLLQVEEKINIKDMIMLGLLGIATPAAASNFGGNANSVRGAGQDNLDGYFGGNVFEGRGAALVRGRVVSGRNRVLDAPSGSDSVRMDLAGEPSWHSDGKDDSLDASDTSNWFNFDLGGDSKFDQAEADFVPPPAEAESSPTEEKVKFGQGFGLWRPDALWARSLHRFADSAAKAGMDNFFLEVPKYHDGTQNFVEKWYFQREENSLIDGVTNGIVKNIHQTFGNGPEDIGSHEDIHLWTRGVVEGAVESFFDEEVKLSEREGPLLFHDLREGLHVHLKNNMYAAARLGAERAIDSSPLGMLHVPNGIYKLFRAFLAPLSQGKDQDAFHHHRGINHASAMSHATTAKEVAAAKIALQVAAAKEAYYTEPLTVAPAL